jgi:hypothetical protein
MLLLLRPTPNRQPRLRCPLHKLWSPPEFIVTTPVHQILPRLSLRLRCLQRRLCPSPTLASMLVPIGRRQRLPHMRHIRRTTMECPCRHRALGCRVEIPTAMPIVAELRHTRSSHREQASPTCTPPLSTRRIADPMAVLSLHIPTPTRPSTTTRCTRPHRTGETLRSPCPLDTRSPTFRTHTRPIHKTTSRRVPALRLHHLPIPFHLTLRHHLHRLILCSTTMGIRITRATP